MLQDLIALFFAFAAATCQLMEISRRDDSGIKKYFRLQFQKITHSRRDKLLEVVVSTFTQSTKSFAVEALKQVGTGWKYRNFVLPHTFGQIVCIVAMWKLVPYFWLSVAGTFVSGMSILAAFGINATITESRKPDAPVFPAQFLAQSLMPLFKILYVPSSVLIIWSITKFSFPLACLFALLGSYTIHNVMFTGAILLLLMCGYNLQEGLTDQMSKESYGPVRIRFDLRTWDYVSLASMAFALSPFITIAALMAGNQLQTTEIDLLVLFTNALLDALTLLVTLSLINYLHTSKRYKYFLAAVAIDVALAAIFAVLSIYIGLLASIQPSLLECCQLLVGIPTSLELDSYFWVMHTTFIPTIILLVVFVLAYVIRTAARFAKWLNWQAAINSKPFSFCKILFLFLAVGTKLLGELIAFFAN